ncbi:integral membrane protein [Colletotrichum orchidophilum]|uniref:Integral membrane protein n=1 Tax=Colletotrichum orchidophilum TaxID=1209926 RepID=A0A1G4ASL5_9PEZI|nr:uncharacterized protein CORC01_12606 [Colletotrichum orchidophilum]OHE92091.1 integral membrane protein [Colletotrichum orchidophilum]
MISYVLAAITDSTHDIKKPENIALLAISAVLIGGFIAWLHHICISVFIVWGACNATEQLSSFYLQYAQRLSAIDISVRFLPAPIGGVLANIVTGLVVHRVRADLSILIAVALACLSPLLMAIADPAWSYWICVFWAMFMNAIGADTLFTISNLLITSLFPARKQAVAGGVYNTIAQIGKSVGLASSGAVASAVSARSSLAEKESPIALLEGYRAAFWYCFTLHGVTLFVTVWGLRKIDKVGLKKE